jgi:predicted HNH restriction endonuclease
MHHPPIFDPEVCHFCKLRNISVPNAPRKLIEIHHIKMRSENGLNDPGNKVPVCSNCHTKIHLGLIIPEKWVYSTKGRWMMIWKDKDGKQFIS